MSRPRRPAPDTTAASGMSTAGTVGRPEGGAGGPYPSAVPTAPPLAPASEPAAAPAPTQPGPEPMTLFVAGAAFALLALVVPTLNSPFWVARAAVLVVAAGLGLPRLLWLLRTSAVAPAAAACALLGVAALSTALADQPLLAVFGQYNLGTGLLHVAGLTGLWALGTALSPAGRRMVTAAIAAGVVLNLAIVVLGTVVDLSFARLSAPGQRSVGLLGNSVHVSALGAGATAWAASRLARGRWSWWPMAAAGVFAVQSSGGRSGLLALAAVVAALLALRHWRAAGLVAVALVVGIALASTLLGPGRTGTGRLTRDISSATGDGPGARGYGARLAVWATATDDIASSPLIGIGPGQFREASTPDRTLDEVLHNGADKYFGDAHNLIVEYTTTTGLLGVSALVALLALSIRRARGPLRWFAVAMLPTYLLQPQNSSTVPVIVLALAVAGPVVATGPPRLARWTVAAAVPVVLLAGRIVYADALLATARLDGDTAVAERAARLLPWSSYAATVAAATHDYFARGVGQPERIEVTDRWRVEAIARDVSNPRSHVNYGNDLFTDRRLDEAHAAFARAVELDPHSVLGLIGLGKVAGARGDWDRAVVHLEAALERRPSSRLAETLLATARRRLSASS